MIAAQTAWLDGSPRWREGRIVWQDAGGEVLLPAVADLALAQRSLHKIAHYPIAAAQALGDSQAWLQQRQARLQLAKQLHGVNAPDLPVLARRAHTRNPLVVRRLAGLLTAEAVCLNDLPALPSAALLACGQRAEAPLRELLQDAAAPPATRALAALTLGAIRAARGAAHREAESDVDESWAREPWVGRAYDFGRQAGLPGRPALAVALLADEDGRSLAARGARARQDDNPLALSAELMRELLAAGIPAARVVALAETAAAAAPLASRILYPPGQAELGAGTRSRPADLAQPARRRQAVAGLAEVWHGYVRSCPEPAVLRNLMQFAHSMLDLPLLTAHPAEALLTPLRAGLSLPPHLQTSCLALLARHHAALWDIATLPATRKASKRAPRQGAWLQERWHHHVRPLVTLLSTCGDVEIASAALEFGIQRLLSRYRWRDPGLYRWMLLLVRHCGVADREWRMSSLCRLLESLGTASAARDALQPLLDALLRAPREVRAQLLYDVLDEVPAERRALPGRLARLARCLPHFVHFATHTREAGRCAAVSASFPALDEVVPEQAESWLAWLLRDLLRLEAAEAESGEVKAGRQHAIDYWEVGPATLAAAYLAGGDFAQFQRIFRGFLTHAGDDHREASRKGLRALERYPGLRSPLAHLFPGQPERCLRLLARLGLASHLGNAMLAPLEDLVVPEPPADEAPAPHLAGAGASWRELLEVAPELEPEAAAYRHAQHLLGGSTDLPAGVRRALRLPDRLARELEHLGRLGEARPTRHDLATRAAGLRARLADRERLLAGVRAEVSERLLRVSAEARLAAAEARLAACYRARLQDVAGPLPEGLRLDGDLMNATLLSIEVTENRRLLLRLLRAHLAGDHGWRERHPANAAFLRTLAERGVDTRAWLAAHPRRYRCGGAAGQRVRLHLEQDPLRILQMGNYFDTCLSFGGCNSFSTVANASELNKRVLYAADATGRIVGRQLLAINEESCLVGFRIYSSLSGAEGKAALQASFRRYVSVFAARCRLSLADGGTVPRLFAQDWYDDGVVQWGEPAAPASPGSSAGAASPA